VEGAVALPVPFVSSPFSVTLPFSNLKPCFLQKSANLARLSCRARRQFCVSDKR
jgi:hypothetical protein